MRILVISSYFGPETSVGVLRVNAFVKYWARAGHEIHVVTMPFSGNLPEGLEKNVCVFQVAPYLIGSRQSGDVQGYAKGASGTKKRIVDFQYWLKRRFLSNYLDPRILWWPKVAGFVREELLPANRYDVIFSTVPSYTAHSAAASVKAAARDTFWVADYRDLWSGSPIFPGCAPVRAFERWHERLVLKRADLIVSINEPLIDELRTLHGGDRYFIVPNGFDDSEVDSYNGAVGGDAVSELVGIRPKVLIVYAGSVLPGGYQDPTSLLKAIKELAGQGAISPGDIEVRFYGDHTALDQFDLARDPVVERFVTRLGKVPRMHILKIQKQADFLLFIGYKPIVQGVGSTSGVVSGKLFEYLISGTEVLAVRVTGDMIAAEMLVRSRSGDFYGDDVEKIKERLLRALRDGCVPKVVPDMAYLDQFRRSRLSQTLLDEVRRRIDQSSRDDGGSAGSPSGERISA